MLRKLVVRPVVVPVMLFLQFAPLLIFPATSFSTKSQEWWLPVLLGVLVVVGIFQLLVRRSTAMWPWHLLSFSQGFNVISRLMMLMPHSMIVVDKQERFNSGYVLLSVLAMLISAFFIWYTELPEVRNSVFVRPRAVAEKTANS